MNKSLLLICLAFLSFLTASRPERANATNMKVGPITSPGNVILLNNPVIIAYLLRNDSLYDAENVGSVFTIRDAVTNEIVYEGQTTTPFIAAYTAFTVYSQLAWNPTYAGRFKLSVDIIYAQDVIPGDNSSTIEVRVETPPAGIFQAYRYNMLLPYYSLFSQYGEFLLRVPPRAQTSWVNVVGWKGDTEAVWIAQNLPLPPKEDTLEYSTYIDWGKIGIISGVYKESVTLSVSVTDTTWSSLTTELLKQGFILQPEDYAVDDGAPTHSTPSPPIATATAQSYARTPILRESILRDSMPNVDLDSSLYNPGTVAGYAGDKNACVPASGANSLEWLEREEEALPSTVPHGIKRGLLSEFCKRQNERGVYDSAFVKAKLHFVDSMKLPIRVKWQSYYSPAALTSIPSPISRFGHSAQNQSGGGANPRVTMDWLVQEMKDDEDVEIFYAWQDSAGNIQGSHAVTVSGAIVDNDRLKGLWIVDDGNQLASGGTRQRYFDIDDNVDPRGPVLRNFWAGRCFIHGAFSESYDSTIKFDEPQGSVDDPKRVIPQLHTSVVGGVLFVASLPERTRSSVLRMVDVAGRVILERLILSDERVLSIDLNPYGLSRGSYLLMLEDADGVIATGRTGF